MAKTYAGKQWGNDQSNALDAPDWRYLATKRVGFKVAETITYSATAGVFTPDSVIDPSANIANNQTVLVNNNQEYLVNKVNSSAFTVTDANAAYANASIRESILLAPQSPIVSNTQPSTKGWQVEHPWVAGAGAVDEVLVAIGGLQMPNVVVSFLELHTPNVGHSNSEVLELLVQLNQGVEVTDTNTANVYIVAIGENANVANINIPYSAALSNPHAGVLVFQKTADLSTGYANGDTLTINATSNIHHIASIVSYKKKDGALAMAAFTGNVAISIH